MKYLEKYSDELCKKLIQKNINQVKDLEDICLDLTDIGFRSKFRACENGIDIHIYKIKSYTDDRGDNNIDLIKFEYKEISEVMERIKDYCKLCKYKVEFAFEYQDRQWNTDTNLSLIKHWPDPINFFIITINLN